MGNSLRDELLKVGLVTEGQLKETRRSPDRTAKRKRKKTRSPTPRADQESPAPANHSLRVNKLRTARFARDPSLDADSASDNAKRALKQKIRELVESQRLNDTQAEIAYNFIKRMYVTEAQRELLAKGELAIAAVEGNHYLLRNGAADALLALAPQSFVFRGVEGGDGTSRGGSSNAEWKDYPVPDDLKW